MASTMALCMVAACDAAAELPGAISWSGTLTLELRDSAEVVLTVAPDGDAVRVAVTPTASYGLLEVRKPLVADGRVASFPEVGASLYTAKFALPAVSDGPCGAEAISLAMSLHRDGENRMVLGGLTAYCGANRFHGTPVRILRLAGELTPG
ncbi:MAG: hypothetical protein EXR75_04220 [Myxococcales bacterium]|nr:hypothetical protein [Myxococcales bacterium]